MHACVMCVHACVCGCMCVCVVCFGSGGVCPCVCFGSGGVCPCLCVVCAWCVCV